MARECLHENVEHLQAVSGQDFDGVLLYLERIVCLDCGRSMPFAGPTNDDAENVADEIRAARLYAAFQVQIDHDAEFTDPITRNCIAHMVGLEDLTPEAEPVFALYEAMKHACPVITQRSHR